MPVEVARKNVRCFYRRGWFRLSQSPKLRKYYQAPGTGFLYSYSTIFLLNAAYTAAIHNTQVQQQSSRSALHVTMIAHLCLVATGDATALASTMFCGSAHGYVQRACRQGLFLRLCVAYSQARHRRGGVAGGSGLFFFFFFKSSM